MFVVAPIVCGGFSVGSLFCFAVLCVLSSSSFAIISLGKRELIALLLLCVLNVMSLLSFMTLPCGAMGWSEVCECALPDQTHFLFCFPLKLYTGRSDLRLYDGSILKTYL